MKKFFACIVAIVLSFSITGCGELENDVASTIEATHCEHQWANATCDAPVTCMICGETAGEALGHRWKDATCNDPKACTECFKTDGDPLGHDWAEATCEDAKTCKRCGETEGAPLGHQWKAATYDAPKTCEICKKTEGAALTKPTDPPTPVQPEKRCLVCNHLVKRKDTNYCPSHDCSYSGCPYPAKRTGTSFCIYCVYHSCRETNCGRKRTNDSEYCSAHKH